MTIFATQVVAQDHCDAACQAARKAQDPLAPVTGLLTDNTIGYGPTNVDTTYNYQLQPVHTFKGENANLILRGLIPCIGVPDGSGGTNYGLSDTVLQAFYVPEVEPGSFKLGYGAQVSLDTAKRASAAPATVPDLPWLALVSLAIWPTVGLLGTCGAKTTFR
ncbi:hypothetical protein [uncultured Shimia sp.]|uniref:hypothetical protein n=1 Tax=uncultured Shimia sp. TaxID=573152 RepID=UPI0026204682|nr:hypothetical protein [uncultured Shimia sp.]